MNVRIPFLLTLTVLFFSSCEELLPLLPTDEEKEPTQFTVTIENVVTPKPFFQSGIFNTPVEAAEPGPVFPGQAYEFSFYAGPSTVPGTRTRISFATMMIASNDLFFAPLGEGIYLYDEDGNPISGDITDQVYLWDAGTEVNQAPGGSFQAPNQPGPDTGEEENGVVTLLDETNDDGTALKVPNIETCYPLVESSIKVTISNEGTLFTVRIENVSGNASFQFPVSPGAYAVHTAPNLLFTAGEPDYGQGLEAIAEDGNPAMLGAFAQENTGLIVPLSPGVWAVHEKGTMPLFTSGEPDRGEGLEAIAEDGSAMMLANNLADDEDLMSDLFNTPVGASEPGPIGPGGSYSFMFEAKPGYNLSFATMFVQSNDLIYTFKDSGLPLFDEHYEPIDGDVTAYVYLYDVGTEADEFPGAGLHQVIRQNGPDSGADDPNNLVRRLTTDGENPASDGFVYPPTDQVIKVTISSH